MEGNRTRQRAEPTPLTAKSRESVRKSTFGKQDEIVKRLLATCDKLDSEVQELQVRLAEAQQQTKTDADKEREARAFESREKVLVIVDWDGTVDVYCEPWVDVKTVALIPGEEKEEALERLPEIYKQLAWPNKLKGICNPQFAFPPNLPRTSADVETALKRVIKAHDNKELVKMIRNLNEFRDSIERERMKQEGLSQ